MHLPFLTKSCPSNIIIINRTDNMHIPHISAKCHLAEQLLGLQHQGIRLVAVIL